MSVNDVNLSVVNDGKFEHLTVLDNECNIKKFKVRLPVATALGTYPVVRNTSGQTQVLLYVFLDQFTFANTEGTLLISTPYSAGAIPLRLASAASLAPNNTVPRQQAVSFFGGSGTLTEGFTLWRVGELLSVAYSANPTGMTGQITLAFTPFVV